MSNLIQRKINTQENDLYDPNNNLKDGNNSKKQSEINNNISEEEMEPLPSNPSGESIPVDTGNVEVLDSFLNRK